MKQLHIFFVFIMSEFADQEHKQRCFFEYVKLSLHLSSLLFAVCKTDSSSMLNCASVVIITAAVVVSVCVRHSIHTLLINTFVLSLFLVVNVAEMLVFEFPW